MLTDDLKTCQTPVEIESWFQRQIKLESRTSHAEERQAANQRALAIAANCRRGHLLPKPLKCRGNCLHYELAGEKYKTGRWGNGAGYRWCRAELEEWINARLRKHGMRSERKIKLVIDWALSDYLWRSLKILAGK